MRWLAVVVFVGIGTWALWPAAAQVTIPTSSTTSSTRPTTSTTRPATSTTAAPGATTTTRRPATTAPPSTAPPRTTSTIPTPATSTPTTAAPEPEPKHSGRFSPLYSWLFGLGLLSGFGLLVLQWFLTRPGRQGWTL
jgi:hypothetical protein